MKRTKIIALVVAMLMVVALLTACGQAAFTVSTQCTLAVGDKLQIKAEGEGVIYASDKEAVATVSESGLITAVSAGEAAITVTAGKASNKVYVKVVAAPACAHRYFNGTCVFCGESDPNYVAPACAHRYLDGACIFCGETDPNYVAPTCKHYYLNGTCIFCGEADPVQLTKVIYNFTANDLDKIPCISSGSFDRAMNKDWNIGWDVASLEATAKKVAGLDNALLGENVPASYATAWRTTGDEGQHYFGNGGWCVDMRVWGENSKAVLYNKINLGTDLTQFRIWMGTKAPSIHTANQCMFKVTLLTQDSNGEYHAAVLKLANGIIPEGAENITYTEDGYVKIVNNNVDNGIGCGENNETVPDGMFIYDISTLELRGDAIVMIELCGIGDQFGTEETESLGGALEGNPMQECLAIKRIMFL